MNKGSTPQTLAALAAALLLAAAPAEAQPSKQMHPPGIDARAAAILAQQAARIPGAPAAKTTATKQRLVASSYRLVGGPLQDSTRAYYSGTNGSDSLRNAFWNQYDEELRTSNAAPSRHRILADSTAHRWGSWAYNQGVRYSHNSAGSILSREQTSVPGSTAALPCSKYVNTYAPTGKLLTTESYGENGGCGVYKASMLTRYNSDGNPVLDSNYNYPLNTRYYYTGLNQDSTVSVFGVANDQGFLPYKVKYQKSVQAYNSAGKLTGYCTVYIDSLQTLRDTVVIGQYAYDAQNRLVSSLGDIRYPGFTATTTQNTYAYPGTSVNASDIRYYASNGAFFELTARYGFHFNAAGNEDTLYYYRVNNGVDTLSEKDPVVYTASGFIDHVSGYVYDPATNTTASLPYDRNQYYYEPYTVPDPQAVADVAVPEAALAFPNPVHDALTVTADGAWTVADLSGRVLAAGNLPATLPVHDWPAGLYLLRSGAGVQKIIKN